jgi:hypothetical protein
MKLQLKTPSHIEPNATRGSIGTGRKMGSLQSDRRTLRSELARESGVLALVRILNGSLLYIRRWQVWMRAFRICGRSLDRGPGGANSFFDFLFSRCQRIVRDVQRALRYFGFDYAVQRFDRIGYFLLVSGISQLLDFNSSGHGFAQTRIGWVSFVLHVFKDVRVKRHDFVYPATRVYQLCTAGRIVISFAKGTASQALLTMQLPGKVAKVRWVR